MAVSVSRIPAYVMTSMMALYTNPILVYIKSSMMAICDSL
jgi:hypothetical protein